MKEVSLTAVETQLKKRLDYPYKWYRKQNNLWDGYTNFIYETLSWEALIPKMAKAVETHSLNKTELFYYASNRWYNFWSAKAVEQIFIQQEGVKPALNIKDSEKDFFLLDLPFDHKTSVFPKQFGKSLEYAKNNKKELIKWLYKNQSGEKRHHLKNRLFIVVHSSDGEHWKLKAEIGLLEKEICNYVARCTQEQLYSFTFAEGTKTLSDIIWVTR